MEGKTTAEAALACHLPKEAGLDGYREPLLKGPKRITQLPGKQGSFQQTNNKQMWWMIKSCLQCRRLKLAAS